MANSRTVASHEMSLPKEVHEQRVVDHLELGISFKKLSCHGSSMSSNYQPTFGSYLLAWVKLVIALWKREEKRETQILSDINGLMHAGEMLLVLGRPGSGCSTFLKALAGDTRGFNISSDSVINYQGTSYVEMHSRFQGERIYLAELDDHFPELTVDQTLTFAAATRQPQPDMNAGRSIASHFGLEEALNTRVGNATLRGISGGEKRRTTIAEAFVSGAQLQFWDNSTRGLDSATARRFVDLLRDSTTDRRSTVAMSLYQASELMYQSFDKVTVLYEGRQIYFGPVDTATDYFTALGFVKPRRATTADFLTSLTSTKERIIRKGWEERVPHTPDDFARVWSQSQQAKTLNVHIDYFNTRNPVEAWHTGPQFTKIERLDRLRQRTATYPLTVFQQIRVCLSRARQRLSKNMTPAISNVVANTILGLVIGSAFYSLTEDTDSLQPRSILLCFVLIINATSPAYEVNLMTAQRPIVEKHNRYAFYHPFTERLASLVCDLPTRLLVSFGLHLPVYFLTDLRRSGPAFFTYWLFMTVNLLTMTMLFRMIGSISRTREQTVTPVTLFILLSVLYGGFVVPPQQMVPWLGWFWRINPLSYTYESLLINELRDRRFPCSSLVPYGPSYTSVPSSEKICPIVGGKQGEATVQGTDYLLLKYGYVSSHLWRNLGILVAMMFIFLVVHLLAAQYIPGQQTRGEVLLFKRGGVDNTTIVDEERATYTNLFKSGIGHNKPTEAVPSTNGTGGRAVLSWRNLSYEVKTGNGPRMILNNVDGWLKPGSLTALMGVTGAGKTTLLDVLAGRATTGVISGDISNNVANWGDSFRRRVGYVQQDDIHLPTSTVREALEFSALLRQPSRFSSQEKLEYVDEVLHEMDMEKYADAVIGVPGEGLNVEQRKRLTIAVELAAKPDLLLFLDEPTSGLDSQTAWAICNLLRQLASGGQTILCTIHQPSSQLFFMFDRLLLLDKGGSTLFFGDLGPEATHLTRYFEENGAPTCKAGDNPAEWMLEVTGNQEIPQSSSEKTRDRWSETWKDSSRKQTVLQQLADLSGGNSSDFPSASTDVGLDQYAEPYLRQFLVLSKRICRDQWRDPIYLFTKTSLCICMSLFNGISFYNQPLSLQGLVSLLFSTYLLTQVFAGVGQQVANRISSGRELFESRERNSRAYSWHVFIGANVTIELLSQTLIAAPMFAAWYYPTGLFHNGDASFGTANRGGLVFVLIWLFVQWASTLSQALAAVLPQPVTAVQIATLIYVLSVVFCGVLVSSSNLPVFWVFMYRVSPLTYFIEGIISAGLANTRVTCSSIEFLQINIPQGSTQTCGNFMRPYQESVGGYVINADDTSSCLFCPVSEVNTVLRTLGIDPDNAWRDAGIMAAYVCVNIAATFGFYWLLERRRSEKKNF
ncbi:P-loop containing nucleoside triphosphate hydrolase protein [Xylariaceae sp. FL0016]|nr:P-loop containing nucleoside triphosphate hydrolase protein [Xylariaceae sp. FL0016]